MRLADPGARGGGTAVCARTWVRASATRGQWRKPSPRYVVSKGASVTHLEPIFQKPMTVLGSDRFRVELDALDRRGAVPYPHNHAVRGDRAHLQLRGDRPGHDRERVVPGHGHRGRERAEHPAAVVEDRAGPA